MTQTKNLDFRAMMKLRGLTQSEVAAEMLNKRTKKQGMSRTTFAAILARDLSALERVEIHDAIERAATKKNQ